ncbi:hypothetical protein RmaAA213_17660 [Rhodothermus marinus]|nr:hypothetical protein RmaAA213_17660 [Rhodothermus marinus]BBM72906.1 hypothetical protein RmaAA338_17710 [Rhodothermus marinus]
MQHLKATIQLEAIDLVGAHAAPYLILAFEQQDIDPLRMKQSGTAQSGQSGTDNDYFRIIANGCHSDF